MKLLFVTCLTDFKNEVLKIFHEARVKVFSVTETTGIKDEHDINLLDDWFGNKDGEYDSLFMFSFTTGETASEAMRLIKEYNISQENKFPIRAFILPVEEASY
ncbi:MAG TPA: hypothetical protein PKA77_15000 [Chitinophagaceae bacterium]|jgi:hypothetical protein|nr:hypothetical protein [Chitinophagaceae bacterium]HMU58103.1 hypothetical protein [Chitinophagaceae bacterium]